MKRRQHYRWLLPLAALLLGGVLLQVSAQTPPPAKPKVRVKKVAAPPPAKATPLAQQYRQIRQRNLFKPLVVERDTATAAPALAEMLGGDDAVPELPPMGWGGRRRGAHREEAPPPSDDWVYAGYAVVDGAPVGILERPVSKESRFLRAGDVLPEGTVAEVTPEQVVLQTAQGEMRLALATTFVATPLNEVKPPQGQGRQDQQRGRFDLRSMLSNPQGRQTLFDLGRRLGLFGDSGGNQNGNNRGPGGRGQ